MRSVNKIMRCSKKQVRPQFSKYCFQNESALAHSLWALADSIWCRYSENCGRICFFLRLIILLTDPIFSHSPDFGRPKHGQKFVVPTFHIHFLNPECVRIPWVLAPENFPVENFRVRSVLQKSSIFHWFLLPPPKKKHRARVLTILMPQTFPIARLNPYTLWAKLRLRVAGSRLPYTSKDLRPIRPKLLTWFDCINSGIESHWGFARAIG